MGNISPLGNDENKLLVKALRDEIILQFLAQMTDLDPNDIVLIRVEIRTATENIAANIVFADCARVVLQGPSGKIQKNLSELWGLLEMPAG